MRFASLASGSSGNSFIIEKNNDLILIDAGISAKQIIDRTIELGLNPNNIKSVFITHEHTDHIRGLDVLYKKIKPNIFLTKKTFFNSNIKLDKSDVNFIKNEEVINTDGFEVTSFPKHHDAADPVSYSITGSRTISVLTDIGKPCQNVVDFVKTSDSIILESNHDEYMLNNGRYPFILKKRILSDKGHLSNTQAGLLSLEHANQNLNNLVLAHLSLSNNTEKLAYASMVKILKHRKLFNPNVSVSTRFKPSPLFKV